MAKIYIQSDRFIEAVCVVAELILDSHGVVLVEHEDGSTSYTEKDQIQFDLYYDKVETIFNKNLKIYKNDK